MGRPAQQSGHEVGVTIGSGERGLGSALGDWGLGRARQQRMSQNFQGLSG